MTFELTILGSSSALPTSEKYPTAQVLNVSERFFLIDCGEGTQIQLRKYKFSFGKIKHVFISHLHGDHFYGLIGFISTRNLLGLKSDLHIYSHSELIGLIQPQLNHIKGEMGFKVIFHPLNFKNPELIYEDKKCEVHSFPLKHSISVCGFIFREKPAMPNMIKEKILDLQIPIREIKFIKEGAGFTDNNGQFYKHEELTTPPPTPRSYAFCTDTIPYLPAAEFIRDVNLLYHEATFQTDMEGWAARTMHSTARQAAEIAVKANAGKLIIGHFSNRYKTSASFLTEARETFPNTDLATEGRRFKVQ
jgi:ribonuclease Z